MSGPIRKELLLKILLIKKKFERSNCAYDFFVNYASIQGTDTRENVPFVAWEKFLYWHMHGKTNNGIWRQREIFTENKETVYAPNYRLKVCISSFAQEGALKVQAMLQVLSRPKSPWRNKSYLLWTMDIVQNRLRLNSMKLWDRVGHHAGTL